MSAGPDREDRVTVEARCAACGWRQQLLVPTAATLELVAEEITRAHQLAHTERSGCPAVLRRLVSVGLSTEGLTVARGLRLLPG